MNLKKKEFSKDLPLIRDYISEHYGYLDKHKHRNLFPKSKAVIALDLDRTIIYSINAIALPKGYDGSLRVVEYNHGKPSSYMTDVSYMMLRYLSTKSHIIPVTARTIPQLNRVVFPWDKEGNFVCLSGARVYIDGKEDKTWSSYIDENMKNNGVSISDISRISEKYVAEGFVYESKTIERTFQQLKVNMDFSSDELMERLENDLIGTGFFPSLHGRKAYISPLSLKKGEAFDYLKGSLKIEGDVFAAGDSRMDLSLLASAHHKMVPLHGEIVEEQLVPEKSFVTSRMGVLAGEEIVARLFLALS